MREQFTNAASAKISSLEERLAGMFKPVAPRKEFVNGLGNRIHIANRAVFVDRVANIHLLAMLAAGLVSLVVFLAVIARALVSINSKRRPVKA